MDDHEYTFHGVDFSGAERHAQKIWVSTWTPGGEASTRPGYSHRALVRAIESSAETDGRRHAWLIDAPLGLPRSLLAAHDIETSWSASIDWLASFDSPREWRRACRKVSRKEPRRPVDDRVRTPFSPVNLRMFKQTWHAIVSVAAPLAASGDVAVLPMAAAEGLRGSESLEEWLEARPVRVSESCPASIIRERGPLGGPYKGPSDANARRRGEILDWLERDAGVPIAPDARDASLEDPDGDALDSLVVLAAQRGFITTDFARLLADEPDAAFEAWIFV